MSNIRYKKYIPNNIEVEGAKVNNLKNINLSIPLNSFVSIAGVSGSGKSSLAMGVLYAEGARRYLSALSTYTRRRIGQMSRPNVKSIKYLPSAIALRQRPTVPDNRSTVGTMSESFNVLRLIFSRLGSHRCPNGHQIPPTLKISQAMNLEGDPNMGKIKCPVCGVKFQIPSAEDYSFNANGACPTCHGTGKIRKVIKSLLIPDKNKTIKDGAVASWHLPGRNFMQWVAREVGIRIDVPFKNLSDHEKQLVYYGPKKTYQINIPSKTGKIFHMNNAKYENAFAAVEDSLKTTKNARAIERLNRFCTFATCPTCNGDRFNPNLLQTTVNGYNIAEVSNFSLGRLYNFMQKILDKLPSNMYNLGNQITTELINAISPLIDLGLDYLNLSRRGNTLSTGELQRIQLGRTLRSHTTGVLYVLDEPSIGLHPDNIMGLVKILRKLISQGNSLVVVDHNPTIISHSDYIIEIGPGAGKNGGKVVDQDTPKKIVNHDNSLIAPFLNGTAKDIVRKQASSNEIFKYGIMQITINHLYNLNNLTAKLPKNRLSVISGFSGAGKSTLVNAIVQSIKDSSNNYLPNYVNDFDSSGLDDVNYINSVPIGKNVRSTVATYCGILDPIRQLFASTSFAKDRKWNASQFSYNVKKGACPNCQGTGTISLDIQYLPSMTIECPVCHGKRYSKDTLKVKWHDYTIADILNLSVDEAKDVFVAYPKIKNVLDILSQMGLGYLMLGESTPVLSGGEAQRLKLVTKMKSNQDNTLFIFDEPSIGLHPKDVQTLNQVFDQLLDRGATLIVIEHDLDVMLNADYMIDLGPKGGSKGGNIVATGTPKQIAKSKNSITGQYLSRKMNLFNI